MFINIRMNVQKQIAWSRNFIQYSQGHTQGKGPCGSEPPRNKM